MTLNPNLMDESSGNNGMVPNIVLIHTDAQVHNFLGCAGHECLRTPHIDDLAREGTRFSSAYACSGVCVPSRASLMTGRYPIAHGVTRNEHTMPSSEVTMGQLFDAAGFATGYFGKTHYGRQGDGWQRTFLQTDYKKYLSERGITATYPEKSEIRRGDVRFWNIGTSQIPAEHYFENVMAEKAELFIRDSARGERPFFCFLSNIAPHGPFTPPVPYDSLYNPDSVQLPIRDARELDDKPAEFVRWAKQNEAYLSESELRIYLAHYYALVSLVDDGVGRIVKALKECGRYENTLIVFTSDHGDFAGAYGILGKSWCMDDCLLRIPLIVKAPDCVPGQSAALVQNVDILPTLLEAAGITAPARMQGVSFLPIMRGDAKKSRDMVFAYNEFSNGDRTLRQAALRHGDWKYVHSGTGHEQLYDLRSDPREVVNMAARSEQLPRLLQMKEWLLNWHVQYSGGYFAEENADIWEKRVNFYEPSLFTGG